MRIRAVDGRGKPVAGAKIFFLASFLEGTVLVTAGTTNSRGVCLSDEPASLFLGLKDGRLAESGKNGKIVFGRVGVLTLRVTDDDGKPIRDHLVSLIPSDEPPPLKNSGYLDALQDYPDGLGAKLRATTDAKGVARFLNMPEGGHFGVITDSGDPESMHLYGSAEVGTTAHVLISHDRDVRGHVYLGDSTTPVAGAQV